MGWRSGSGVLGVVVDADLDVVFGGEDGADQDAEKNQGDSGQSADAFPLRTRRSLWAELIHVLLHSQHALIVPQSRRRHQEEDSCMTLSLVFRKLGHLIRCPRKAQ